MNKLRAVGIDPGFATTGVAVMEMGDAEPQVLHLGVIKTAKASKKDRNGLRVSVDDQNRLSVIWDRLIDVCDEFRPHVFAFEVFSPRPGRVTGLKTMLVCGMVQGLAKHYGRPLFPFIPADIKIDLTGKKTSSKEAVEDALSVAVGGWDAMMAPIPKGQREHAADAAGHAYLAIQRGLEMRRQAGLI